MMNKILLGFPVFQPTVGRITGRAAGTSSFPSGSGWWVCPGTSRTSRSGAPNWRASLASRTQPIHLVAHSFGALTAIAAARLQSGQGLLPS